MRLLTLLALAVLAVGVLSSTFNDEEENQRSPRIKRFSLSKKFKFWFNRDKDKNEEDKNTERKKKSFGQKIKDGWTKFKSWVKKHKSKKNKRYQMKKEDAKSQLPKYLRDKYAQGKKVFQSELDEAYFKMMKQRRRGVSIIDIINSINKGNDVNLRQVDIVEPKDAPKELQNTGGRNRRDVMRERFYLWHDRIIPYEIKDFQSTDVNAIKNALNEIESRTCLKFVPRTTQTNWIQYFRGTGCYSNVGKVFWQEGFQQISLGYGCMTKGTIQHETMHALGFYHEQARPDRDRYVKIFFDNIRDDQEHNFEKQTEEKADTLNIQYDFSSVMHYGKFSFAQDPSKPTILPIQNPNQEIGQRDAVSDTDIEQINILYSCSVSGNGWSKWSEYGACSVECIKQRSRFCMNSDKASCPNPTNYGYNRYGVDLQEAQCSSSECAGVVDGNWGSWGDWGKCSEACGTGKHSRTRQCNNPTPQNGGESCKGSASEEKECFIKPCNSGSLDCTFDDDSDRLCGWTSEDSMNFQWTRNRGGTPSTSTGPSEDKTSGSGYYMYIETSSPAREGWKARLTSSLIGAQVVKCMKLSYHMYGASIGTLNIIAKDQTTNEERILFEKSGNQGNTWQTIEVTVQNSNPYKIVLEGVRGFDWQGDIAIDDIEFTNGACIKQVVTTPSPTPTILRVGCFQDQGYINGRRPFTHRGDLSGLAISTNQLSELRDHYYDVVRYCGSLARNNGFKFFAIQQYYECWTGPTSDVQYSRDGESKGCWPEQQMGYGPHIVGQYLSNMVYQWSDL